MQNKIKKIGPYVLLAAVLGMLLLLNCLCQQNWLDSDMAAEMRFSKLLAEEGRLFATPNWYYSTEFRVLYTQLIMGPLFRILDDWQVIRTITNMLSYGILVWSYLYCVKPLKLGRVTGVVSSLILLLPFSETVMTHVHMGNTYIAHMVIIFLVLGMFQRLMQGGKTGRQGVVLLILYLILAAICGISGVRYLLVLQCPLLLTAFVRLFGAQNVANFRMNPDRATLKQVFATEEGSGFLYALLGIFGSVAGYAMNALVISKSISFQDYGVTNFIAIEEGFFDRIQYAFGCMMLMLGYIPDRSVLSLRGVISVSVFIMLFLIALCTVKSLKRTKGNRHFIAVFFTVNFLLNVFIFVFTSSTMVPRYFLPLFALVPAVLGVYVKEEERKFDRLAVTVLLAVCLLLGTAKTVMSLATNDRNAYKEGAARFLEENGYNFGFATYWNANIITEMTDGKVEVAHIDDPVSMEFFRWSSPVKYYEGNYREGEVFLLVSVDEKAQWAGCGAYNNGREAYIDGSYSVFLFDSLEELLSYREVR